MKENCEAGKSMSNEQEGKLKRSLKPFTVVQPDKLSPVHLLVEDVVYAKDVRQTIDEAKRTFPLQIELTRQGSHKYTVVMPDTKAGIARKIAEVAMWFTDEFGEVGGAIAE